LTYKCNLKCDFCLNDASNKADKDELGTAEWLKFFERLRELRVFNISFSGGEIFLRDDLFVLLGKLRENRMHRISLLTNGTLITKETASRLSRLNIKNIAISLDGLENRHDQVRGRGSFRKTTAGIQHLLNDGIYPQVSFTPIRSNYEDLGPLIDFSASLGIRAIQVNTLSPEGRCLNIYEDIVLEYPDQVKAVLDVIEEKKKKYPGLTIHCELGFHYHLPESYEYLKKNPGNYKIKNLKDGCGAASTSCVITPIGDMVPCEGFLDFKGGSIKERDLLEIWEDSENFKRIRELSKTSMDQVPYCKDCKYIYLCDGGCRASAYLVYKDLLAPGITCPYWKEKQESGKCERNK
jgi:SynChlorMet cassette radical SAM/SPASM protein ScmE